MVTPGGYTMSVAMTNCGHLGWTTDQHGYLYSPFDPLTGVHWPPLPDAFADLCQQAATAAGYADFQPDACLINRYTPGQNCPYIRIKTSPTCGRRLSLYRWGYRPSFNLADCAVMTLKAFAAGAWRCRGVGR
jgi:hypothetical protein